MTLHEYTKTKTKCENQTDPLNDFNAMDENNTFHTTC